jgi:hypothetical protein
VVSAGHDNRILDLADRVLVLEDGRLSSFAAAVSADAGHLLTALKNVPASHLGGLWSALSEADFLDLLQRLRAEVEQYLNVIDFGGHAGAGSLFQSLAGSVLQRVAAAIGASRAAIRLDGRVMIELGAEVAPGPSTISLQARDREHEVIGTVE